MIRFFKTMIAATAVSGLMRKEDFPEEGKEGSTVDYAIDADGGVASFQEEDEVLMHTSNANGGIVFNVVLEFHSVCCIPTALHKKTPS